jgi:hypothetical protein
MPTKIEIIGTRECYIVDVTNMGKYYTYNIWRDGEIIDDGAIELDLSRMFSELAKIVEKLETKEVE